MQNYHEHDKDNLAERAVIPERVVCESCGLREMGPTSYLQLSTARSDFYYCGFCGVWSEASSDHRRLTIISDKERIRLLDWYVTSEGDFFGSAVMISASMKKLWSRLRDAYFEFFLKHTYDEARQTGD